MEHANLPLVRPESMIPPNVTQLQAKVNIDFKPTNQESELALTGANFLTFPANSCPAASGTEPTQISGEPSELAPPGFERQQVYSSKSDISIGPVRRSPRLKEKLKGPYLSPTNRAQINKFGSIQPKFSQGKVQEKQLKMKVSPEYHEELLPITVEQAKKVLAAAGLELDGPTMKKLMEGKIIPGL